MGKSVKVLRLWALMASALGFLSITLSGEIATTWLALSWLAWTFSLLPHRFAGLLDLVRRRETLAVLCMISMLFIDFFTFHNSIFIAVTHFLLLFQILKLAGEKARKDCLQIFFFSFFQILASCTLSVDPSHALVLLALIPISAGTLFWNQIAREGELARSEFDAEIVRRYRRMAALICVAALPLNLLLTGAVFLIVPRLTLNVPLPGFSGQRMGYIDQVNLAQKGTLQQNAAVVLWLSFPAADERKAWSGYLRGDTLSDFNGQGWSASRDNASRIFTPDSNGVFVIGTSHADSRMIHHSITLSDTTGGTLFSIGRPLRVIAPLPSLQLHEGGSLHWLLPLRRPLHYDVISENAPGLLDNVRAAHLELPNIPLERIRAMTLQISGKGPPLVVARSLERYLQDHYRYSTNYGDEISKNPVDAFLFDRREGSCGHFASALALMLRLQNIPSRLVAGYLKGEWNEPGQAVVIRQRDAHAWVEAYIAGRGWISFDPSPRQTFTIGSGAAVYNRYRQYGDYLALLWNRFVIQYDFDAQIKGFEHLKVSSGHLGANLASWWEKAHFQRTHRISSETSGKGNGSETLFPSKKSMLFFSLSLVSFLILAPKRFASYDSSIRFYHRFLEQMGRAGCPKQRWETGQEFLARLSQKKPEEAYRARRITEAYYQVRFREEGRS